MSRSWEGTVRMEESERGKKKKVREESGQVSEEGKEMRRGKSNIWKIEKYKKIN